MHQHVAMCNWLLCLLHSIGHTCMERWVPLCDTVWSSCPASVPTHGLEYVHGSVLVFMSTWLSMPAQSPMYSCMEMGSCVWHCVHCRPPIFGSTPCLECGHTYVHVSGCWVPIFFSKIPIFSYFSAKYLFFPFFQPILVEFFISGFFFFRFFQCGNTCTERAVLWENFSHGVVLVIFSHELNQCVEVCRLHLPPPRVMKWGRTWEADFGQYRWWAGSLKGDGFSLVESKPSRIAPWRWAKAICRILWHWGFPALRVG